MKFLTHTGIVLLFWISSISMMMGQDSEWEKIDEGEIEDASFVVEKSRLIELPQEARKFIKIPPLPVRQKKILSGKFDYTLVTPTLPPLNIRSRALKIKAESLEKLYGGNISAGFGNYVTPYLDVSLFNKRENKYALGGNFVHLSSRNGPVDGVNSGNGRTNASFNSKYFGSKMTAGAGAYYNRSMVHFYGYDPDIEVSDDTIKQVFNTYNVNASISNTDKNDDFDYLLGVDYNYVKDNYQASESKIEVVFKSNMYLREGFKFYLDADIMLSNYKNPDLIKRRLIKIKPYVYYRWSEFDITGGLNFAFKNDTISSQSNVLLFPYINIDYFINDNYKMFLGIDGDVEKVDYQSTVEENPWIAGGVPLFNRNKKFGIKWGLQGNVSNLFNFLVGVELSEYKNKYFFLNDSINQSRFNLDYEYDNTSVLDIYGELVYSQIKDYRFSFRGDYYNYNTKSLLEAWHQPTYKLSLSARYNLYDKILFGADMYFMGGIKAWNYVESQVITLSSIVDINFNVNYLFSDQLSVFIKFDNITGKNYERYYRYPSRGIQVLAGVTFNF